MTDSPEDLEPLTPREDFPIDVLPDWARTYAEKLAYVLQIDPSVPALSIMGVTALAVQGKAQVAARDGWAEPLSFWCFVGLKSGNRKTPALLRPAAPLYDAMERENLHREKFIQCLDERIEVLKTTKGTKDKASKLRRFEESRPPLLDLFATDATMEAIPLRLAEQNESYGIVTDEPNSISKIMQGLYSADGKSANLGIMLSGYSGGLYRRTRVKSPTANLKSPALTVMLIGQPAVLTELSEDSELEGLGFFARMLVASPPDLLGYRKVVTEGIPFDVKERYEKGIQRIHAVPHVTKLPTLYPGYLEDPPEPWPKGLLPRHDLQFEPDAFSVHIEIETRIEPMLREGGILGAVADFGAKLSGQIARWAGLLHCLHQEGEWAKSSIPVARVDGAVEIGRYALHEVLKWAAGTKKAEDEDKTLVAIRRHIKTLAPGIGKVFSSRQLYRKMVGPRSGIKTGDQLHSLLEDLVDADEIGPVGEARYKGRPTKWVVLKMEEAR